MYHVQHTPHTARITLTVSAGASRRVRSGFLVCALRCVRWKSAGGRAVGRLGARSEMTIHCAAPRGGRDVKYG